MIINVIENRYSYESEFWCKDTKKIALCQEFEAALRAALRAASPNKPFPTAKKRYVKFTQRPYQPQISLTSILNEASPGFKQALLRQEG